MFYFKDIVLVFWKGNSVQNSVQACPDLIDSFLVHSVVFLSLKMNK